MLVPNQKIFLVLYFYSKLTFFKHWEKNRSFFNARYNFMPLVNQNDGKIDFKKKERKKLANYYSKLLPTLLCTWVHIILVFL